MTQNEVVTEFMDACELVLDAPRNYDLTDAQKKIISQLCLTLSSYFYSNCRPDEECEIIKDPKWHRIQKLAQSAYEKLTKPGSF